MKKWIEIARGDKKLAEQLSEYYELCLAPIPAFPGIMMAADDGFGGGLPTITKDGVEKLRKIHDQVGESSGLLAIAEQTAMRFQGYGSHLDHNPDGRSATIIFLLSNI